MKHSRLTVLAALLAWLLPVLTYSAETTDPVIGTWKLDVAKSSYHGAPTPKSETRVYETTADGIKLTTKTETAAGEQAVTETTYRYDGKDYPLKGNKMFDTVAVSRLDSHTSKSVLKLAGKEVGHFTRVVSHDGKTLTATTKITGPDGGAISEKQIYTKQ